MSFTYSRRIHLRDTDAAGVVYFANILNLCHEAYEASLMEIAGLDAKTFFSSQGEIVVPIAHANASFYRPMFCGDHVDIQLFLKPPERSGDSPTAAESAKISSEFEIAYRITRLDTTPNRAGDSETRSRRNLVAQALTRHVCIHPQTLKRTPPSAELITWLAQIGADLPSAL